MDNEELVNARGGWTPGKLEYKPLFDFPPKPIALLKWLFNYPDGFIFPWAAIHFLIAFLCYYFLIPSKSSKNAYSSATSFKASKRPEAPPCPASILQ